MSEIQKERIVPKFTSPLTEFIGELAAAELNAGRQLVAIRGSLRFYSRLSRELGCHRIESTIAIHTEPLDLPKALMPFIGNAIVVRLGFCEVDVVAVPGNELEGEIELITEPMKLHTAEAAS